MLIHIQTHKSTTPQLQQLQQLEHTATTATKRCPRCRFAKDALEVAKLHGCLCLKRISYESHNNKNCRTVHVAPSSVHTGLSQGAYKLAKPDSVCNKACKHCSKRTRESSSQNSRWKENSNAPSTLWKLWPTSLRYVVHGAEIDVRPLG